MADRKAQRIHIYGPRDTAQYILYMYMQVFTIGDACTFGLEEEESLGPVFGSMAFGVHLSQNLHDGIFV